MPRFTVKPFTNPAGTAWRVSGYKRDRTRIRENFKTEEAAQVRQLELESEYNDSSPVFVLPSKPLTRTQARTLKRKYGLVYHGPYRKP